ncbi:MAG: preprotein translocase subunit SecA [Candidatus Dadabacteria bacterium]|nr:MAG: preprotein translocase subunit SecA [Candidatus Dadabacteria bacterium]
MIAALARKIFGTRNDRILKSLKPLVFAVGELEPRYKSMSDEELRKETDRFKEEISKGRTLDDIMPEAFALVREASVRTVGMRPFDVQIIGAAVLHSGKIAEMKTGEGKTLVAVMPAYLNALEGKGVHIVTVNDYLAKRDAEWMGRIYNFLGLSVGVIVPGMDEEERQKAYKCDITYGQNNEFGFDYLRDNMKFSLDERVQRGHHYAIVDEVDSILIDEARTPLIISGPAEDSTDLYERVNQVVPRLKKDVDFEIDVKTKNPTLTEEGIAHVESLLGVDNLYAPKNAELVHHVNQSLKAHFAMERDVDYVVRDGEVIIVDEFTGRLMPGRRWSDGLHQAVEAKEGVKVARENQTLASITFQNYFRMYEKLAGMTGTADTEAVEFKKIYDLEVVVVPTNKPMIRVDHSDSVYRTKKEKFKAVCDEIEELYRRKQPVLVGTISIEQSEKLSEMLKRRGIPHNVLNAKHHEREAEIVAQAGRLGAVTISTNMAGRGTDIMLGGNPEFLALKETGTKDKNDPEYQKAYQKYKEICEKEKEEVIRLGGLHIIGTERHESRRIDNQLRGRSGRQGDPGSSRFYVSLEDDLMLRFGGEMMQRVMLKAGMEEGEALEGKIISRAIEKAQRRVEGFNFDIRKHLLEYDDVMNKQREVIYALRTDVLSGQNIREMVLEMRDDLLEDRILELCDERIKAEQWDLDALFEYFRYLFGAEPAIDADLELSQQAIFDSMRKRADELYQGQVSSIGEEDFSSIEQHIFLQSLDHFWKLHLLEMDYLKEGIGLRGYGQKNPLHEYQREGFLMFQSMLSSLKEDVVRKLYGIRLLTEEEARAIEEEERKRREAQERNLSLIHGELSSDGEPETKRKKKQESFINPERQREKLKQARKARRKKKK